VGAMGGIGTTILLWLKAAKGWLGRVFTPSEPAWTAAAWALFALWGLLVLSFLFNQGLNWPTWEIALGVLVFYLVFALASGGLLLLVWLLATLRLRYRAAFLLALPPVLLVGLITWGPKGAFVAGPLVLIGFSLLIGAGAALRRRGAARARRIGAAAFLALGVVMLGLLAWGLLKSPADPNPALVGYHLRGATLALADPGKPGPYPVRTFTYGSGVDRHRPEYAGGVLYRTMSVDGSKLDPKWTGLGGWARTRYWGFGPKAFPLQGRVWMPDTRPAGAPQGPFPLVLIVHGNHSMEVFSDPGYAYLGGLLASQGFIVVSVDENFFNSSTADFINPLTFRAGEENSARGWLLLEHLAQWRAWSQDPKHPLFGKVDMEHIALVGHSRGGQSVATANAFNDLSHDPDDATLAFNFHFKLAAIAAIAPIDGQNTPRDWPTPMRDTNYLVIHGSMDGDVTSFTGSSQYSRAGFSGGVRAFKASLYVKGANHGQFNTVWGRYDSGLPFSLLLDPRPIMDPAAQRRIAAVYLSAFLQATLQGKDGYRPLFQDARNGAGWLPDDFLVNNYADSDTAWLANYQEDLDPGTGSSPGVIIRGRDLSIWRETYIRLKSGPLGETAAKVADNTDLVFSASNAGISSLPSQFKPKGKGADDAADQRRPLDWSIVVTDARGEEARLPLSHDQLLYPQIKGEPHRLGAIDGAAVSEVVLRRYRFALKDFVAANPRLDLHSLRSVRFDFDRSPRGAIALDDVGLATPR
jgi:hypothetical protein